MGRVMAPQKERIVLSMGHHQRVWRAAGRRGRLEREVQAEREQESGDATGIGEAQERSGKVSTTRNNRRRGWIRGRERSGAWRGGERCKAQAHSTCLETVSS